MIDVHALFWFCSHCNVSLWTNVPLDKQNNRTFWTIRIQLAFFPHTERVPFGTLLRAQFAILPTLQHSKKFGKNEQFSFIFHVVSHSSWTNQPEYCQCFRDIFEKGFDYCEWVAFKGELQRMISLDEFPEYLAKYSLKFCSIRALWLLSDAFRRVSGFCDDVFVSISCYCRFRHEQVTHTLQ